MIGNVNMCKVIFENFLYFRNVLSFNLYGLKMKKSILQICILIFTVVTYTVAQPKVKLQTGISYMEHFSVGMGIKFGDKHFVSASFGSNAFVKLHNFSSYMLHYDLSFFRTKWSFGYPKFGISGGYSNYTDNYYRWELLLLTPNVGFTIPLNTYFDVSVTTGLAIARELSMTRIRMGDVGWYRKFLPEFKLTVIYNL